MFRFWIFVLNAFKVTSQRELVVPDIETIPFEFAIKIIKKLFGLSNEQKDLTRSAIHVYGMFYRSYFNVALFSAYNL